MGLINTISKLGRRWLGGSPHHDPHSTNRRLRICRFEQIEERTLMAADLHVGAVYYEQAAGDDLQPNIFTITFQGGAPGTQLTRIVIDGDKDGQGRSSGDVFFDTAPGGFGVFQSNPFKVISSQGFQVVNTQVVDGGMRLVIDLAGFDVGEKLVFSIDVDEFQFIDPVSGDIDVNAVAEGGEFQRSHFIASFAAPHYEDITVRTQFWDEYDQRFSSAASTAGSNLGLPPDRYSTSVDYSDMTAGAVGTAKQIPLPSSIAGVVFSDMNLNNKQDAGEKGLGGVQLMLLQFNGTVYVPTQLTTVTDSLGNYKFDKLLPGQYRVVETQPGGYFSVGAKAGTVNGQTRGSVTNPDIISDITLLGGENSIRNDFAEALPNSIAGRVGIDCEGNPNPPPIANVTIKLLDSSGQVIRTTKTDADGRYKFDNLQAGTYTVVEEQPTGYFQGDNHVGSAGGVIKSVDEIGNIVLTAGIHGVNYDFCELLPVSIAGMVHINTTGDCANPANPPLSGVVIHLLDSSGKVIGTTTTDAGGKYKFDNLAPGTYGVREVQPVGYFNGATFVGSAGGTKGSDIVTNVVLTSGLHAVHYDFCELLPVSIQGKVHVNTTGDCANPANPPLAGVTVHLLDSQGNIIGTQTTDADGRYKFENLAPGTYGVREVQPVGYFNGATFVGSAGGTKGSDIVTNVVLTSGMNGVNYDFCEIPPAGISGYVYKDLNNNGIREAGEGGIAGVTVKLKDANGQYTGDTVVTDANGFYQFTGLRPGTYGLAEAQPVGYYDGLDTPGSAGGTAMNPGDMIMGAVLVGGVVATDYNFGELLPVSLQGKVHVNTTGDCENPANPPLAGVTVHLLDSQGNIIGTQTTDANGRYKFENLAPGTYGVREVQPTGYFNGATFVGSAGGVKGSDLVTNIVLTSGMSGVNYDFCEIPPAGISGYVYKDLNNNGIREAGEGGIAGVTVKLKDANGQYTGDTAVTDANGFYQFTGLRPGTYGLAEVQPVGYYDGLDTPGSAGGTAMNPGDMMMGAVLVGGVVATDYNFGELPPTSLQGRVHVNTTGDCENPANPPLAGVTVQLLDSAGNVIATTTTSAAGVYRFDGLAPGTYGVRELQPQGYFNGATIVGNVGGAKAKDLITGIILVPGAAGLGYDFCEIPPSVLSGYVFQDGPPIPLLGPNDVPNVKAVRDGRLTPDDTRLPGVRLELRDGITGLPILGSAAIPGMYPPDQTITVVTDANGFYEFRGLPPGVYGVFNVKPEGYLTGIDTAGSLGGVVISELFPGDDALMSQLLSLPYDSAILQINLPVAGNSINNNFSVVTTTLTPIILPPPPPAAQPAMAPALFIPPMELIPPPIFVSPFLVAPILTRAGGALYTWHLSVIDGGHPRGVNANDAVVQLTAVRPGDEVQWEAAEMDESEWEFLALDGEESEGPAKRRQFRFGMKGGIPITGDFNGDGTTEVGIFKDGYWFIDMNDNGVWDAGDLWAKLGHKGDRPVTGDWDGDGKTDIGIYGPAWPGDPRAIAHEPGLPDPHNENRGVQKNVPRVAQRNTVGERKLRLTSNGQPRSDVIDHVFLYGTPGDHPVVGDWNGDGIDTIAVFRDGIWFRDTDGDGKRSEHDARANFGQAGDIPIVGDFNGDGTDELGIYRDGIWYIDSNGNGVIDDEDLVFELGGPGDLPVVGDWNGDGRAEPGVYRAGSAKLTKAG